jgi:hypothetical protein
MKNTIVLGVFSNHTFAEDGIRELESAGYDTKDISIVMKDTVEAAKLREKTGADSAAGGIASGATTGGVVGALAGLLIGIGAITIPGIGAILIGGPLAVALGLSGAAVTTFSGAVTGALAGGLVGGLVKLGLPEQEAQLYQKEIETGAILVAVPAKKTGDAARKIMEDAGATQVKSLNVDLPVTDTEKTD